MTATHPGYTRGMELRSGGSGSSRMPLVAMLAVLIIVGFVATVARFQDDGREERRSATLSVVDTLRIAELSLYDFENSYVPCGTMDVARLGLSGNTAWETDGCWKKLGWTPEQGRGVFYVAVDGDNFEVHGLVDGDGDGTPAEIVATKDLAAHLLSKPEVF